MDSIRRHLPRLGTRKLHYQLRQAHISIGRDALFRLLKAYQRLIRRKVRTVLTTQSSGNARYPLRIDTGQPPLRPNTCWVSDITYLRLGNQYRFLALVADAYSRYIVGYALHHRIDTHLITQALHQAQTRRPKPLAPCLLHSDQGTQYNSHRWQQCLHELGFTGSMSRKGNPYDNACMERMIGILKQEMGLQQRFRDPAALQQAVVHAIHAYNYLRPHSALQYQTPAQKHYLLTLPSITNKLS